jgi:hypothetical protein
MTPNIGPRGQRRRLRFGLVALGAAVVLGVAVFALHAPRLSRAILFVPLWLAGLGVFQARDKT